MSSLTTLCLISLPPFPFHPPLLLTLDNILSSVLQKDRRKYIIQSKQLLLTSCQNNPLFQSQQGFQIACCEFFSTSLYNVWQRLCHNFVDDLKEHASTVKETKNPDNSSPLVSPFVIMDHALLSLLNGTVTCCAIFNSYFWCTIHIGLNLSTQWFEATIHLVTG